MTSDQDMSGSQRVPCEMALELVHIQQLLMLIAAHFQFLPKTAFHIKGRGGWNPGR